MVLACALFACIACDEATGPLAQQSSSALQRAAGIDEVREDPICVDLLVDGSEHSPGTDLRNVMAQVDAVLPMLAVRTGVLRLWLLRGSVEQTTIVASEQFKQLQQSNLHARDRARDEVARRARERLLTAAQAVRVEVPTRSPVLEALTRIGLTSSPYPARLILLLSDGKEMSSLASWECRPIDVVAVTSRLDSARVLLPNSLRGTTVVAVFFDITPSTCHDSVGRHLDLLHAWQALLKRAGARAIFTTASYNLTGENE